MEVLAQSLKNLKLLASLLIGTFCTLIIVDSNKIENKGAELLAKALQSNTSLSILSLGISFNFIKIFAIREQ